LYPHDYEGHFVAQEYLPPGIKTEPFYEPGEQGREAKIAQRLRAWWKDF
jgi:putative ATPase